MMSLHLFYELNTCVFLLHDEQPLIPIPASPAPLLLRLFGSESSVLGQRYEVVPAVNREGFKIFQDILTTLTVDSEQLCTLVKQNIKEEELHLKKKKKKA